MWEKAKDICSEWDWDAVFHLSHPVTLPAETPTYCTGHKVDPGGLSQNVKSVTVCHQETWKGNNRITISVSQVGADEQNMSKKTKKKKVPPGTKISPKPRREKGRSQRARGEKFNLGTLSTMGSWRHKPHSVSGSHLCWVRFVDRKSRISRTHLFVSGGVRWASRNLHHYTLPTL